MKTNEEYVSSIYKKRDERLKTIKRRKRTAAIIIPIFIVCIGIATLPGYAKSGKKTDDAAHENSYYAFATDNCAIQIQENFTENSAQLNENKNQTNDSIAIPTPVLSLRQRFSSINELREYLTQAQEKDTAQINKIILPLLDCDPDKLTDITLICSNDIYSINAAYCLDSGCEFSFTCRTADSSTVINGFNRPDQPVFSGDINGAEVTLWQTEVSGQYFGDAKVDGALISIRVSSTNSDLLAEEAARFTFCQLADIP